MKPLIKTFDAAVAPIINDTQIGKELRVRFVVACIKSFINYGLNSYQASTYASENILQEALERIKP